MVLEYDRLRSKVELGKGALWLLFHAFLLESFARGATSARGMAHREIVAVGMVILPAFGALTLVLLAAVLALIPFAMRHWLVLDEDGVRSHSAFEPLTLWAVLAYARRRGWDPSELEKPMWTCAWSEIRRAQTVCRREDRKLVIELDGEGGKREIALRATFEGILRDEAALFKSFRAHGIAVELPPPPILERRASPLWRATGRTFGNLIARRSPQRLD